jgi:hypothetical protein
MASNLHAPEGVSLLKSGSYLPQGKLEIEMVFSIANNRNCTGEKP